MEDDQFSRFGSLLADIGGELAELLGGDPHGAYLYAEAGEGWDGASVYKDEGRSVRYYDPSSELSDLVYDLWLAEEPHKRWSVMEYKVEGANFDVSFKFPDEVPVRSFAEGDRRETALKRRFGDKPVIYPPPPNSGE